MTDKIKRSMAVHPHPIVYMDTIAFLKGRFPTEAEYPWENAAKTYKAEWRGNWGYKVKRVTNSTEFGPGMALTREQIDRLIEDGWTIAVLA